MRKLTPSLCCHVLRKDEEGFWAAVNSEEEELLPLFKARFAPCNFDFPFFDSALTKLHNGTSCHRECVCYDRSLIFDVSLVLFLSRLCLLQVLNSFRSLKGTSFIPDIYMVSCSKAFKGRHMLQKVKTSKRQRFAFSIQTKWSFSSATFLKPFLAEMVGLQHFKAGQQLEELVNQSS